MKKNILDEKYYSDKATQKLIEYMESENQIFSDCVLYYNYPIIRELDEEAKAPNIFLISPQYGIVIFKCDSVSTIRTTNELKDISEDVEWMEDYIFSKLLKSTNKRLKSGKRNLSFNLSSALFLPNLTSEITNGDTEIISRRDQLINYFNEIKEEEEVDGDILSEALAIIEGSVAIIKPKDREIDSNNQNTKASILKELEAEIAKFDDTQKYAALSQITGPQRIRGLAGSGKTIILCMKAALLHLKHPEYKILYTFTTKSLYDYVERLITRFYKTLGDGKNPDFKNSIQIRHAWGGENIKGVYYEACKRENVLPISFSDAAMIAGRKNAFNYICKELLKDKGGILNKEYDYILIDEAQDFDSAFYKLCRAIVKDDCIIWGYDDLQNIFDIKRQDTKAIFKDDELGLEGIDLVKLQSNHPEMENDIVLARSYRNLKEILVLAHAIGLGIYNDKLIQSLENNEHWNDVGYKVVQGNCKNGEKMIIERPTKNSPLLIKENRDVDEIIKVYSEPSFVDEVNTICNEIEKAIFKDKLRPDDIIVISLDDKNSKKYFNLISTILYNRNIYTHNLSSNSYEKGFKEDECVTLTTIYKAKGNEAAMVFVIGCDVFEEKKDNIDMRNKMFTAITRAKAWIRISGVNIKDSSLLKEIEAVKDNEFRFEFTYKDSNLIKRDLSDENAKKNTLRNMFNDAFLKAKETGYSEEDINKLINDMLGSDKK